jgi:hypothetical protein
MSLVDTLEGWLDTLPELPLDSVLTDADESAFELSSLDGALELGTEDASELSPDGCDDRWLDGWVELEPIRLPDDCGLTDEGLLSLLDTRLDVPDDNNEAGFDDRADCGLEVSLDCDGALGSDDGLCRLEEPSDSLDILCEDCEWLEGPIDEPDALSPEVFEWEWELLEAREALLSDERLSDECDDVVDDSAEESLLFEPEDPDGLDLLRLLEERADGVETEPRDSEDLLSDETDELGRELLRSELLGELLEEFSKESLERDWLLDDRGLLEAELRRLLPRLLFDELSSELESLLSDDSFELGDDRDDSLTLEIDLLDP